MPPSVWSSQWTTFARRLRDALTLAVLSLPLACSDEAERTTGAERATSGELTCSISSELIFDGGPGKDGIPALTNPELVGAESPAVEYLRDDDRVIGLIFPTQAIAIPLNILWWHEIVNLDVSDQRLAVTHCPLTGSSLVFDRASAGGAAFGVSGLLYMNNLLMYDRHSGESLWPQMLRAARCGPSDGTSLAMVPALELSWLGWRTLHPDTKVVSSNTGHSRNYTLYPYGNYDAINNPTLLFPMPRHDSRRPPKERVLGIPSGIAGGMALPFGTLAEKGNRAAVHVQPDGWPAVIFWDGGSQAAMAFRPHVGDRTLTFEIVQGRIVDRETGSVWRVDGLATAGELAGERLPPVASAFVSYWFAWSNFYDEATLWTGT